MRLGQGVPMFGYVGVVPTNILSQSVNEPSAGDEQNHERDSGIHDLSPHPGHITLLPLNPLEPTKDGLCALRAIRISLVRIEQFSTKQDG